ncbi:MAG TPA: hypothetical protein VJ917_03310 [Saprospiraceae bacterium]|nr:hypothetical protein [Saprospiraceae bacterium]
MTLGEFGTVLTANPLLVTAYFSILPITAMLAWLLGNNRGHLSPWKYFYTVLVYLSCLPGLLAFAFAIYLIVVERQSVLSLNLYLTLVPVLSMLLTLLIIKRNVDLDLVPGFDKITGFMLMIFVLISFLWFLSRIRLVIFSYMPLQYFALIFLGLLFLLIFGWRKVSGSS